jgi:hypothetical protein
MMNVRQTNEGENDNSVMTGNKQNDGATGCGKDAAWKSQTTDFPTPLANPAKPAGFALSHSPDDYRRGTEIQIFHHLRKRGHF